MYLRICIYYATTISKKVSMNFKEIKEAYSERFGGRKGNREMMFNT